MNHPFRCFNSSPEVIRLAVMTQALRTGGTAASGHGFRSSFIITARRMISGEVLKYRKGLFLI